MNSVRQIILFVIFIFPAFCLLHAQRKKPDSLFVKDWKSFYDQHNLEGFMILEDSARKKKFICNSVFLEIPASPASTFNIVLAMIGLEEGVLKDEKSTLFRGDIKYTSTYPSDTMTLEEGFTNNRDWFFIRLSTLIGKERIQSWLKKLTYGNMKVEGEPNRFWINGKLAISPWQQLIFIKDFYAEKLPFSKSTYDIVKKMMFQKEAGGWKLFGKRGSNKLEKEQVFNGWFVGYGMKKGKLIYYVSYIESKDMNHPTLIDAQKKIPYAILEKEYPDMKEVNHQ